MLPLFCASRRQRLARRYCLTHLCAASCAVLLLSLSAATSLLAGQTQGASSSASSQLSPELAEKKQQAVQLLKSAQAANALPLFEELSKAAPADGEIQFGLAMCLFAKARNDAAGNDAKALMERARQAAHSSRDLGFKSDLLTMLLNVLDAAPDPLVGFSQDAQVNQKMKEGEAAFTRGDNDAAIAAYSAALQIDPKLYQAALFAGDACFRKKDLACFSEWYRKAILIDPNTETAHRYWADALAAAGKMDEARDEYIEAIIANPYIKQTWTGLAHWAKKNNVAIGVIQVNRPAVSDDPTKIVIESGTLQQTETGREAWVSYGIVRVAWRSGLYAKSHPKDSTYRHSLEEEVAALSAVVEAIDMKKATRLDPQLAALQQLKQQGMLACWILLNGADQGIAQDYVAYRETHRDLLKRYLATYVLHPPAVPAVTPNSDRGARLRAPHEHFACHAVISTRLPSVSITTASL